MEVTEADGRCKSIVVVVSPLEALMLDVAEAFTAMDTSDANFISQHHSSGLPSYLLFKGTLSNCFQKISFIAERSEAERG